MNCTIQSPTMFALSPALQLLLMMLAGWVNRHQLRIIEYLKEENRVLKGTVRLTKRWLMIPNEPIEPLVSPSQIPCRDHQSLHLALFSILPELPGCRRDHGRARGCRYLRNHS